MEQKTIVIVEDEPDIMDVIEHNLEREGYLVISAEDGESGLAKIRSEKPDLVILDLMLPGVDGLDICRELKEDPVTRSILIIMLTAKGEESDIVLGLGLGADDYVTKPFSPKELMARVKAVLRRTSRQSGTALKAKISIEGIVIDSDRHKVTIDKKEIQLTLTEYRILQTLASSPGRVFTRDSLLSRSVGDDAVVIDRNIDVHVRALRKKLGGKRNIIETVRGVGYRFVDV